MSELQDFLDSIEGLNETDKCIQWLHFICNHIDERIDNLEDEVEKLEKKLKRYIMHREI
jgi:NTP pyrophosphatase (non-canonical NTP hydrolase)